MNLYSAIECLLMLVLLYECVNDNSRQAENGDEDNTAIVDGRLVVFVAVATVLVGFIFVLCGTLICCWLKHRNGDREFQVEEDVSLSADFARLTIGA